MTEWKLISQDSLENILSANSPARVISVEVVLGNIITMQSVVMFSNYVM